MLSCAYKIILSLVGFVSIIFLVNNINGITSISTLLLTAVLYFVIFLFLAFSLLFCKKLRNNLYKLLSKSNNRKIFSALILVAGLIIGTSLRSLLYHSFSYQPISDPATFYTAASGVADNVSSGSLESFSTSNITGGKHGVLYNQYVAFYPFTAPYDILLGFVMRIISNKWLATIILNTTCDLLSSFLLFIMFKKKKAARVIVPAIWFINPFGVLFSVLSLPICVTNLFVILSIYMAINLIKNIQNKQINKSTFLLFILLGLLLGLGNQFRPIFTVGVIAICITIIAILIANTDLSRIKVITGTILMVVSFLLTTFTSHAILDSVVQLETAKNPSGWSFYVGSSWDYSGEWNADDVENRNLICQDSESADDCHHKLLLAGIDRYKSYGINTVSLAIRKLLVTSSDQSVVYNMESLYDYNNSTVRKYFETYTFIFILTLFSLVVYLAVRLLQSKQAINYNILFVSLIILGLFFMNIFTEVSSRYAQVLYPCLIIFCSLAIHATTKRHIATANTDEK